MTLAIDDNVSKLRLAIDKKIKELEYDDDLSRIDQENMAGCIKIVNVFADHRFTITTAQAAYIWAERSDNWCAVWLDMRHYDEYDAIWHDLCENWAFYETTGYHSPFFLLI